MQPYEELLWHAGLLSGLGAAARPAAASLAAALASAERAPAAPVDRTCVDGGRGLLLAFAAPAPPALRVMWRAADVASTATTAVTVHRWQRRELAPGSRVQPVARAWQIDVIAAGNGWRYVVDTLDRAWLPAAERAHARLGPLGRVERLTRPEGPGAPWLSWHLDRPTPPAAALERIGLPAAWAPLDAWLGRLFGRPLSARARPWSIAVPLGEAGATARLGTSLWAAVPETAAKSRRLAAAAAALGGDARAAEALYKRLLAGHRGAVGAAIELSLSADGALCRAEFILRAPPEPAAAPRPEASTMSDAPEQPDHMTKISLPTLARLDQLAPDENPIVSAAIDWARTPTPAEMDRIAALGGVFQGTSGIATAPSSIATLRLPLRAIVELARLDAVRAVEAGLPLGGDDDTPPARPSLRP